MSMDALAVVAADERAGAREVRAAVLDAIEATGRQEFSISDLREHLPAWATGPQVGATITALVRSGVAVWTGRTALSGNARQRNNLRPVKVYRLTRPLPSH